MRRTTIALLASLEAFVAALIGFALALVPLMLLWAVHFGLAVDAMVFVHAAAGVWLLGHGVNLTAQADPVTASRTGLEGAAEPFTIAIALLGIALLSISAGLRIGRRSAAAGHALTGALAAMAVFALAGAGAGLIVDSPALHANPWWSIGLPAFVVGLGALIGSVGESVRNPSTDVAGAGPVRRLVAALPPLLTEVVAVSVRIGAGAAFGVLAVAGVLLAVAITLDYATIAGLYQALDPGIDGGIALTMAELALLPNLVVWTAAWLLGPGFALGAGSVVSSGSTVLGPVPGIPLLGALPDSSPALGGLWLVVPVLLGFVGAWIVATTRGRVSDGSATEWWRPLAVAAGSAIVAGATLGVLARWSSGAVGPGRLAEIGPDGFAVALVAAATIGIGALVGGYAALLRAREANEHVGAGLALRDDRATGRVDRPAPRFQPVPDREPAAASAAARAGAAASGASGAAAASASPVGTVGAGDPAPSPRPVGPATTSAPAPAQPARTVAPDPDAPWWRREAAPGRDDGEPGDGDASDTEAFDTTR
ncbi:DUF6350 family protein [Agromyces sp. Leaf222]|uniref:cell division protein PerM n=1 Tax=Agromyces sp. Leaf222 TaxID=1735688 RepID=UPI0006F44056|nr:DUF6350 family protein [Agromyces sp. Leaf222]KQM82811.1 hypothetical protein ASE68_05655 [Agromyces sp. Leaf222]